MSNLNKTNMLYRLSFPNDWKVKKISEICSEIHSGGTPLREKKEYYENGDIPWIKSTEVRFNLIEDTGEKINNLGLDNSSARYFQPKTILFALYGQGPTAGRVAYIEKPMTSNQAILGFTPNLKIIDYKYLFFYFQLIYNRIRAQRDSGPQPNFNATYVKNIRVSIPPIPEQFAIVATLENVDALITTTQHLIDRLQTLKRGLMQRLFTQGIGHTEFQETKLGRIPKVWQIFKLGEIMDFKNGINFTKEEKGNIGTLTVDVKNMYNEGLGIELENLYRVDKSISTSYILQKGDILFVRSSLKQEGVGWPNLFLGDIDESVSFCGFLIRGRLRKSKDIDANFLTYYLRTPFSHNQLVSLSGQVAITNVSQDSLKFLKVLIPPINEIAFALEKGRRRG